jgi:arylsulfatase A-like enzyme
MYESSIQVPLMMVGPGIEAGKKVDAQVYLQDIMATTLDLAGLEKPAQVDFNTLMPLVRGETDKSVYDAIYGCYFSVQRMIRTEKYKMIIYPAANRVRLYDLENDPLEMNDLAEQKGQYTELLNTLLVRLKKLQKVLNDPIDVTPAFNKFINGVAPEPLAPYVEPVPTKKRKTKRNK